MRFLVVEDSAVDRHLIVSMLEKLGHQVDTYQNPTGVLEKVATGNYAAVILDIVMPEQDGFKFLREIRLNSATANQYVIFCSSKKTPVEISYGIKRAGANDYITKPVTKESLEQALQKV
jgi:two-component system chemotaxis response regulator CheY